MNFDNVITVFVAICSGDNGSFITVFVAICSGDNGSFITVFVAICSGDNGSVLHYGHAGAPNTKVLYDGDMW